ncbi:GNAT family N-acetyltransferase [Compostibacter hankyongensis]|uniref:GNAT family N-acetyltransferase n=1 Tax=Compostibacter hankyongensis TaxID=1007089 RepID=A0ABP8GA93_9BACT
MIQITGAATEDLPLIRQLAEIIWPPTFKDILSEEQMTYMLELMYNLEVLQRQAREGHTFLLLYADRHPSGYAHFSAKDEPGIYKLHKLYLLPALQGQGAGRKLLEGVCARAQRQGGTLLELQVNRHNKAKAFYEKMGFTVYRTADIPIGNGYFMNDFIMRKPLMPEAESNG